MLDLKKKKKQQVLFPFRYMLIRDFKGMNSSMCFKILCLAVLKQVVDNLWSNLFRAGWEEISVIKNALSCLYNEELFMR